MLAAHYQSTLYINTLRPRKNGRHFADDIIKCIFLNENVWIPIKISLKFVPKGRINNIPALVQIMAWRRPGDKPLSEPMMVSLPTHICVTRPQWVKRQNIHPTVKLVWMDHIIDPRSQCSWATLTPVSYERDVGYGSIISIILKERKNNGTEKIGH